MHERKLPSLPRALGGSATESARRERHALIVSRLCLDASECVHRVPSACTVCRVCYFLFDAAKCASSRLRCHTGVTEVSQRTARTPYHFAGISTHVRRWRGRPNGESNSLVRKPARALLNRPGQRAARGPWVPTEEGDWRLPMTYETCSACEYLA